MKLIKKQQEQMRIKGKFITTKIPSVIMLIMDFFADHYRRVKQPTNFSLIAMTVVCHLDRRNKHKQIKKVKWTSQIHTRTQNRSKG